MADLSVRVATVEDVDAIATLTRVHRHRLAEWSPAWWRVADGADEVHPLWLGHLVASDGPVARVAVDGAGAVVGCAISVPQGDAWFVDDVSAASPEAGDAVLAAVAERPARTCVATLDEEGTRCSAVAGLRLASSCWIGSVDLADPADPRGSASAPAGATRPEGPVPEHTFGPALTDGAGDLLVDVPGAGRAWGSGPLPPPPIYGAGGTVAVLTAVEGPDRAEVLAAAQRVVAGRGDVLVCLVVATSDTDLAAAAAAAGLVRTVDVWSWSA